MKRYLFLLMCTFVLCSGFAQDFDDEEAIPNMGVVTIKATGRGGFPAGTAVETRC